MGLPQPIHTLSGHCSVIYNNTLYAYSPDGFQSIALTEGAKWNELPMDISITGAQCVKAVPTGNESEAKLYIVGGTTNATSEKLDYPGLMHYTFAKKKWDWVEPTVRVTKDRLNHAAAYLPESKSIVVYSGSQEPANVIPSDQTFVISTETPFGTTGYQGQGAPPVFRPMLMPWDDSHAVMLGGSTTNKAIFLFDAASGWQNLGVTLEQGIQNQDQVQCTVVSGDDGSKVLETFDMSVTPNKVTRVALLKEGGERADPGQTVGAKAKRLLTIQQWPDYNGTLAPTVTRAGFSIAQTEDDLAVISGGSVEDPLCIFNQKANNWVNTTELFAGNQQVVIQSEPTASATLSSTLIPSATGSTVPSISADAGAATEAAGAPVNNKTRMLTVLAATLGAIFSIAALLILLLFFLKYKKNKNRKAQQTGYVEKDRLSFADRGAEFMSEAGGSVGQNYSASMNASHSSLAIINQAAGNHKRGMASDASEAGLVTKKSPLGYSEPVELSKFDMKPEPVAAEKLVRQNSNANSNVRPPPSRSSGWSRYFANNEATNLAHMSSGRSTFASERTSTGSQSLYTDSRMYGQPPTGIAPLDIPRFDGQHINRVPTGSPTLGNSRENLHVPMESMQAELARADSNGSARSGVSRDDHYARAPVESWTPMNNTAMYDRPPSSNYGDNHRDGASSYYPDATSSYYPKSGYTSFFAPGQLGMPQERESVATVFPGGQPHFRSSDDRESGALYPMPPPQPLGMPQDRESTFTVFPGAVGTENQPKKSQPDMSWLNLGTSNK